MRDVFIVGIGQTPVDEHWDRSLRDLGAAAVIAALKDASAESPDALFVGNMLSGVLCNQENLGTIIADFAGFAGIEAMKIEAACASGGAAVRAAYLAVASGAHDLAVAVGLEKMTDLPIEDTTAALASAADADFEAAHGVTFTALNALMMRLYIERYKAKKDDFAAFVVNAHKHAKTNPNAMFRQSVTLEDYARSPMVAEPICILDSSPVADGAAAIVMCSAERAKSLAAKHPIKILGSALATDTIGLGTRREPLRCEAIRRSAQLAFKQAGVGPKDIQIAELHDAFSIVAAVSLEASGFVAEGQALPFALEGNIGIGGKLPMSTLGGLKARGHPVGASGAYQVVEAVQQLRGQAGHTQVKGCRLALTQSVGGLASVVVTHILGN
ncbi:MAG TPA: thiolase domain-containing protein [Planctomycetota bacterium]|jgi:acetyl-CoA C-acetyltransferase